MMAQVHISCDNDDYDSNGKMTNYINCMIAHISALENANTRESVSSQPINTPLHGIFNAQVQACCLCKRRLCWHNFKDIRYIGRKKEIKKSHFEM